MKFRRENRHDEGSQARLDYDRATNAGALDSHRLQKPHIQSKLCFGNLMNCKFWQKFIVYVDNGLTVAGAVGSKGVQQHICANRLIRPWSYCKYLSSY